MLLCFVKVFVQIQGFCLHLAELHPFCPTPVGFTSVLDLCHSLVPYTMVFTSVTHLWPTLRSYTRQHSDTPSPPHDPLKTHASHMIRDYIWPGSIVLLPCRDLIPYRDDTRHIHVRHRAFFFVWRPLMSQPTAAFTQCMPRLPNPKTLPQH